jgi:hypothetical protein
MYEAFFLCPRCLSAAESPGKCQRCGVERLGCRPGEVDDPCRRPLMSPDGRILTRAPLWWLRFSVAEVARRQEGR